MTCAGHDRLYAAISLPDATSGARAHDPGGERNERIALRVVAAVVEGSRRPDPKVAARALAPSFGGPRASVMCRPTGGEDDVDSNDARGRHWPRRGERAIHRAP